MYHSSVLADPYRQLHTEHQSKGVSDRFVSILVLFMLYDTTDPSHTQAGVAAPSVLPGILANNNQVAD